jgi:hypothetical protein
MNTNQTTLSALISALCSAKNDLTQGMALQTKEVADMYSLDAIRKIEQAIEQAYEIDPIRLANIAKAEAQEAKRYNGWANYATWNVNLWFDNDGLSEHWESEAHEIISDEISNDPEASIEDIRNNARRELAQRMESWVDEGMPEVNGFYSDLLGSAMGQVDYDEIAEHYTDDVEIFQANWNLSGYMPDATACLFTSSDDAKDYIYENAESYTDSEQEAGLDLSEQWNEAQAILRTKAQEVAFNLGKYYYFVSKV